MKATVQPRHGGLEEGEATSLITILEMRSGGGTGGSSIDVRPNKLPGRSVV
jgi:hypothetical protein